MLYREVSYCIELNGIFLTFVLQVTHIVLPLNVLCHYSLQRCSLELAQLWNLKKIQILKSRKKNPSYRTR